MKHVHFLERRCLLAAPASAVVVRDGILSVIGTSGSDVIRIRLTPNAVVTTLNGVETSSTKVRRLSVNAMEGDDLVDVTPAIALRSYLSGQTGRDTLIGGGGPDVIDGGPGDDMLIDGESRNAYGSSDTLLGAGGSDTLIDSLGDDSLVGAEGDDQIEDAEGADTVVGGAGADTIIGQPGDDPNLYDGGDGADSLTYADSDVPLGYSFSGRTEYSLDGPAVYARVIGTVTWEGRTTATLTKIEQVYAGERADVITLRFAGFTRNELGERTISRRPLLIDAGGGNDVIDAKVADAYKDDLVGVTVTGGTGADTFTNRSTGVPRVNLASGDDTMNQVGWLDGRVANKIAFGEGYDTFNGDPLGDFTMPPDLEAASANMTLGSSLTGNALDNRILITSQVTAIYGGNDNDRIAAPHAETIDGGAGNDRIDIVQTGFVYADENMQIRGGDGDDVIRVTAQRFASIFGEAGNDQIYTAISGPIDGGTGRDRINSVATSNDVFLQDGERDLYIGWDEPATADTVDATSWRRPRS